MRLEQYLRSKGMTSKELAAKLKVSVSSVSGWRQQRKRPRDPLRKKIQQLTKGKVGLADWQ